MIKSANLSECRKYRYALWRIWNENKPIVTFIGLNPSTADETLDDPTIRRCVGFARKWGMGGLCMANLFAYRATKPKDMKAYLDPIGPENDKWLKSISEKSEIIITAWGNHGAFLGRSKIVLDVLKPYKICYLKLNGSGEPAHPLYLPEALEPVSWSK